MDYMEKLDPETVYQGQRKGIYLLWLPPLHRELGPCSSALHHAASLTVAWETRSYGLWHRYLSKFRSGRRSWNFRELERLGESKVVGLRAGTCPG